jgi:hypothetical protein
VSLIWMYMTEVRRTEVLDGQEAGVAESAKA